MRMNATSPWRSVRTTSASASLMLVLSSIVQVSESERRCYPAPLPFGRSPAAGCGPYALGEEMQVVFSRVRDRAMALDGDGRDTLCSLRGGRLGHRDIAFGAPVTVVQRPRCARHRRRG